MAAADGQMPAAAAAAVDVIIAVSIAASTPAVGEALPHPLLAQLHRVVVGGNGHVSEKNCLPPPRLQTTQFIGPGGAAAAEGN
jgi:hypothetical protein